MEANASGEVFRSEPHIDSQTETVAPTHVSQRLPIVRIVAAASVVLLAILSVYFFVNRKPSAKEASNTTNAEPTWVEYKNPDGFVLNYPSDLSFNKETSELVFPSQKKLGFRVKKLEVPLVEKVADLGLDYTFYTIDSRTGFEIKNENVTYYYFPLFGESYLEIVSEESGDLVNQIVSGIKFTPPDSQS